MPGRISSRLPDLYLRQFGDETLDARRRDDGFAVDLARVETAGVDQAIKGCVRDGKNVFGLFGRVQLPRSVSTETARCDVHSFTSACAAATMATRRPGKYGALSQIVLCSVLIVRCYTLLYLIVPYSTLS